MEVLVLSWSQAHIIVAETLSSFLAYRPTSSLLSTCPDLYVMLCLAVLVTVLLGEVKSPVSVPSNIQVMTAALTRAAYTTQVSRMFFWVPGLWETRCSTQPDTNLQQ